MEQRAALKAAIRLIRSRLQDIEIPNVLALGFFLFFVLIFWRQEGFWSDPSRSSAGGKGTSSALSQSDYA